MTESFDIVETRVEPVEPAMTQHTVFTHKPAGFWMRFWAFLIDLGVIAAVVGIVINPIFHLMDWSFDDSMWYAPIGIISGIVYYAYFILMTKFLSQTVGKMAFGLKVQKDNGEKLDWLTVLFREAVGRFISNAFLKIPYLIVIFSPNHKAVHDFAADTVVIHEQVYEKKEVYQPENEANNIVATPSI